jgi:release factor glutamine methyltransferase
MTLRDAEDNITKDIEGLYQSEEARSIAKVLLQDITGFHGADYLLHSRDALRREMIDIYKRSLARLIKGEPVQYITGKAHFYGFDFKVSPAVLIPRRETEELVDIIVRENKNEKQLSMLDIGTGSGCIAIALKKILSNTKVNAMDVSEDALEIARENARILAAEINFIQADILKEKIISGPYDIIVSNPPYIAPEEAKAMHKNVLEYEPHLALFTPGNDHLVFYDRIAMLASEALKPGGILYFEINESKGEEMHKLLELHSFQEIKIIEDMQGKERFAVGIKK